MAETSFLVDVEHQDKARDRMTPTDADLQSWATALQNSGKYRVLRRFVSPGRYTDDDGSATKVALAVDVETTGLDAQADAIIQLCAVPFSYCPGSGRIFELGTPITYFEDPGRPIPPEVTELTGITNAMVAGKRIDDERIARAASAADLVIAHNAGFDRRFLERRLPLFIEKPWACSQLELPWARFGLSSAKLEYLMIKRCGLYFAAHSADEDCLALIHLLATPFDSGELPMSLLLESARRSTARIWALQSPYESKDALKTRRYRWNPNVRTWFIDVPEERQEAECEWLRENVYTGSRASFKIDRFDARSRYSSRLDG